MPQTTIPIRSLTGGISQQPSAMRLTSQCGEKTQNFLGTVVEGLFKRQPSKHAAVLAAGPDFLSPNTAFKHHLINRSDTERHFVMAKPYFLRVFDLLEGTENDRIKNGLAAKTIYDKTPGAAPVVATTGPGPLGDFDYLDCPDPANDLAFLSLADYTLVLNKTKTPAMKAALSPTTKPRGVIKASRAEHSLIYALTLKWDDNGATQSRKVTYTPYSVDGKSPNEANSGWKHTAWSLLPNEILEGFKYGLMNGVVSTWAATTQIGADHGRLWGSGDVVTSSFFTIVVRNGTMFIERESGGGGGDFEIIVDEPEGASGQLEVTKDQVQIFTDLPAEAHDGTTIKVVGDDQRDDPYYVKFSCKNATDTYGPGEWNEAVAEGQKTVIDEDTMPHALIRQADGNFRWTPLDGHSYSISGTAYTVPSWGDRIVGSELDDPDPPFIGNPIRGMFFWKDRVGLIAKDQVAFSESGEYFNHFRTTMQQLLETERIQLGTGDNRSVTLEHGVPLAEHLVLFSEDAQFIVRGDRALTPQTVSVAHASAFDVDKDVTPVSMGSSLMASTKHNNSYAGVLEITDASTNNRARLEPTELTKVCPALINNDVRHITVSTTEQLAAVHCENLDELYIYSWFVTGGDRIQSAWWKFVPSALTNYRHVEFVGDALYIFTEPTYDSVGGSTELCVEIMNMSPLQGVDGDEDFKLDRLVESVNFQNKVNNGDGTYTFELPYKINPLTEDVLFKVVDTTTGALFPIVEVDVGGDETKIRTTGDPLVVSSVAGTTIDAKYRMSPAVLRDSKGAGVPGSNPLVKMFTLMYENTSRFDVVQWPSRIANPSAVDKTTSVWTSQQPGEWDDWAWPRRDGSFRTMIGSHSDDVVIQIENATPFPCRFIGASLSVNTHPRFARRRSG